MGVSIESFERDAKVAELIPELQGDGALIVHERVDPVRNRWREARGTLA